MYNIKGQHTGLERIELKAETCTSIHHVQNFALVIFKFALVDYSHLANSSPWF